MRLSEGGGERDQRGERGAPSTRASNRSAIGEPNTMERERGRRGRRDLRKKKVEGILVLIFL